MRIIDLYVGIYSIYVTKRTVATKAIWNSKMVSYDKTDHEYQQYIIYEISIKYV